jgi:hypothetical protein
MRFNLLAIVPVLSMASALALEPPAPAIELPKDTVVGVYVTDGSAWREAQVEIVNWKSGGAANGRMRGGASYVAFPGAAKIEVLIHPMEGKDAVAYQLLRLHSHSDSREFRSSIGQASGDLVPAKAVEVAPRIWQFDLAGLPNGEYGFLPPADAVNAATPGKIYTFAIGRCEKCKSVPPGVNLIHAARALFRNGQGLGFDF